MSGWWWSIQGSQLLWSVCICCQQLQCNQSLFVITLSAQYLCTHTRHCLLLLCLLSISAHMSLSVVTLSAQYLSTPATVSLLCPLSISAHTHTTVCHYSVCSVSQHTSLSVQNFLVTEIQYLWWNFFNFLPIKLATISLNSVAKLLHLSVSYSEVI
jgi:hypothetical protein